MYLITANYNTRQRLCVKEEKRHLKSHHYLRALDVAVRIRHGVIVIPAVLAVVVAVRGSPGLIVHRAVEALCDTVI